MITKPKLSDTFFDTVFMTGAGYLLGKLGGVNRGISAAVCAIASIANYILFKVANHCVRPVLNQLVEPHFKISSKALYVGTNALVSTIAILAAHQFNLISRRVTGIGLFTSTAIFVARIHLLN